MFFVVRGRCFVDDGIYNAIYNDGACCNDCENDANFNNNPKASFLVFIPNELH